MFDALSGWLTSLVDWLGQSLTSAPLWVQAPVVMLVVIPLCGVLAMVWLRVVDVGGAVAMRGFQRLRARVGAEPDTPAPSDAC